MAYMWDVVVFKMSLQQSNSMVTCISLQGLTENTSGLYTRCCSLQDVRSIVTKLDNRCSLLGIDSKFKNQEQVLGDEFT